MHFHLETRVLQESDYPLMERVLMGPLEEEAKIYLRDKSMVKDISNEVRVGFVCLMTKYNL